MANEDDRQEANSTMYILQRCFNHLNSLLDIGGKYSLPDYLIINSQHNRLGSCMVQLINGDQWQQLHYQFSEIFSILVYPYIGN